ncbi:propionyl-CoA synthase [Phaeosphaeriaceae sp. PMI808]|nr:propionyl-CoA synthase [Phaeosphaeriaceae sp. PMI808]
MDPGLSQRSHPQDEAHKQSLEDPGGFWGQQAEHLSWHKKPNSAVEIAQKTLKSGVSHASWEWFPGGYISTCFNCVDRHVAAGRGSQVAVYYDSPVTNTKEIFTYSRLLSEVETLAGVLRNEGVGKGDVVMLYMPMIPAALIAMLAINRLGAIHSTVFGGFAPHALAQRIDACLPKVLLTASCGIIGDKAPIAYQPLVEEAINLASHTPDRVMVWQRQQLCWKQTPFWNRLIRWIKRTLFGNRFAYARSGSWQELVKKAKANNIRAACVPVRSNDPVYIMHTSGTTGSPKGVLRTAGGHAVGLRFSMSYIFNIRPGDVMFTASDIGWVVGHSYILYAPLLAGASTVLYEGKPVGTPNASAFWRVVDEYKVNTMFTAPTALRAVRREDPNHLFLTEIGRREGLRSLRALFLAGERSEPTLVSTYQDLLTEYGAPSCHVIDNWWSTETGSPITSRALMPFADTDCRDSMRDITPPPIKPGSAGKQMPGFNVQVVDDVGVEVERGSMGNLVLGLPLAPTAFNTLWREEDEFYKNYLKRFDGKFLDTGDAGWIDEDGYVHVMSRNDDVLNVSAYRLSSGAIEQAILSHPLVTEACVVGIPDALKGQLPFAFINLSYTEHVSSVIPDTELLSEIQAFVRKQVGAFAALGGVIQGNNMIPKTRSGKTLRRVLRELVANGVRRDFTRDVAVPSTIEDAVTVEIARAKVEDYFKISDGKHKALDDENAARP